MRQPSHTPAERLNIQALEREAEAERIIKQAAFAEVVKFTDDAYHTMFGREPDAYKVVQDDEGNTIYEEKDKPLLYKLTEEDIRHMELDSNGKIQMAINGIFNNEYDAALYAIQHSENKKEPIYISAFPKAGNAISELMVAGYQKFLESDFWGLTNHTQQVKDILYQYGSQGLDLSPHSRGSMTLGNAMKSMERDGAKNVLSNTDINPFGPAFNAQETANLLYKLSGGAKDYVSLQNHNDDFVGRVLGRNPATYYQRPKDSSKANEWINMFSGAETVHSCGGSGKRGCYERYGELKTIQIKAQRSKPR